MDKNLVNILQNCRVVKFGDFTLTKGIKSNFYVDLKKALTKPDILKLISKSIIEEMRINKIKPDYISCIELGGIPIGVAVSLETNLPLIIVRKSINNHGIKSRIIGDIENNKTTLLIEDVTTTGGSVINAAQVLRNEGLIVTNVISVIDREEGANDALSKAGLRLISLVNTKSLLKIISSQNYAIH